MIIPNIIPHNDKGKKNILFTRKKKKRLSLVILENKKSERSSSPFIWGLKSGEKYLCPDDPDNYSGSPEAPTRAGLHKTRGTTPPRLALWFLFLPRYSRRRSRKWIRKAQVLLIAGRKIYWSDPDGWEDMSTDKPWSIALPSRLYYITYSFLHLKYSDVWITFHTKNILNFSMRSQTD